MESSASAAGAARLASTLARIDAANAEDPNRVDFRGQSHPKETLHSLRASHWLDVMDPEAGDLLRIAVRAHHLRRWTLPRTSYPEGRAGYHAWRRDLQERHAKEAAAIMRSADPGYDDGEIDRVSALIRKRGLGRDPEVQTFEDVLCLVFVELQLAAFAEQHDEEKVVGILSRTLPKMSERAIQKAAELASATGGEALLARAVARVGDRPRAGARSASD